MLQKNYSLYFSFGVCSSNDHVVTAFSPRGADSKCKEAVEWSSGGLVAKTSCKHTDKVVAWFSQATPFLMSQYVILHY